MTVSLTLKQHRSVQAYDIWPGIIPIFPTPGVSTPGQLGPTNLVLDPFISLLTLCISLVGIPSVMHTTKSSSASTASSIASAANGGGTNTPLALQFVSFLASATVLKTGTFKCFEPPFSGVTPPYYFGIVLDGSF